ncbi:Hypothetical protein bglu_2g10330 [Burkholderia glumae BGR1]|nr:Hypothetical protein bglu_2g10330 [Burkholderia glumae BGR1]
MRRGPAARRRSRPAAVASAPRPARERRGGAGTAPAKQANRPIRAAAGLAE